MAEIENVEAIKKLARTIFALIAEKAWKQSPPPAPELVMLCRHRLYCPTLPQCLRTVEDTWSYFLQSTVNRRPRAECHAVPVHKLSML